MELGQLSALAAAVSEGTFDAAARRLHVTPSAISQRIKALETSVGQVLMTRSKPVRPTPGGEAVLRLARQVEALTEDTLAEIGASTGDRGVAVVPLAVNADSLATWFPAALAAAGPGLAFDVRRDDQERTADLLREGTVMAAVTSVPDPVPGCSVRRLGRMRYHAAAAEPFAARWFAGGATTEALLAAPVVVYDRTDRLQDRYLRRRTRRRPTGPRHYLPDTNAFVQGVGRGLGWGMLLDEQIAALPEPPRRLDPARTVDVVLYWQQWRLRSAALDAVAAAVRNTAERLLV
ncbi:MAG TPA: ArgP/LysG family DNA-binding transcriptional regulator [Jatrophihabitans sp.]|nr:ArgP/LysG family DNA-binding transcriptional regulator [Jatrophihabitans sp.]